MATQGKRRCMERKIVEQLLLGKRLNEISRELHVSKGYNPTKV